MNQNVGIWIDHRKALIAEITDEGADLTLIRSRVEKHLSRAGDSPLKGSYEAHLVGADDRRQRALTGHLNRYYDRVIESLPDSCSLFIFGPGEAKGELRSRLLKIRPHAVVSAVEATDKMTDRQVVAKVRGHFAARMTPA